MTNEDAIKWLETLKQDISRLRHEDLWPYVRAIDEIMVLLKEQETIFLKDGHHVRCTNCGEYWCDSDREGNPFPMDFCPHCGKAAKWE